MRGRTRQDHTNAGCRPPGLFLIPFLHDDVIKWKHFPRYWPFVRGIHRSLVNSPHKDQWRGSLKFSLICVWINGWSNNREDGDLRRHRAHYDATIMLLQRDAYVAKNDVCGITIKSTWWLLMDWRQLDDVIVKVWAVQHILCSISKRWILIYKHCDPIKSANRWSQRWHRDPAPPLPIKTYTTLVPTFAKKGVIFQRYSRNKENGVIFQA